MMKTTIRNVVLVVVLFLLAYIWRAEGIHSAVKDAKLTERTSTADSLSRITDTLFADSLTHLKNKIVKAELVSAVGRAEINRLKQILDSLPPPARTDTGAFVRDSVIQAQDSLIAEQEKQIVFWKAVADAKDSINLRLRQDRDRYRVLAEAWEHQAHPSLASRVLRGVPYFLAGAVVWQTVKGL